MKKVLAGLLIIFCTYSPITNAQSHEVQQLLLNWEKLSQFKKILQNMYDGYKILHKGYTAIKEISEGSFSLHKGFLDELLTVNPVVKKYKQVSDIINYEIALVREYKAAFQEFKEGGSFTADEIQYLAKVYGILLKESAESLEELMLVLTSGSLRMSDDERLQAIDRIYAKVEERFSFLKSFNNNTALLSMQRRADKTEID
jgi:hypothetical protein